MRRLGGVQSLANSAVTLEWYKEQMERTTRNYETSRGKEAARTSTATGLAMLRADADSQEKIKQADRNHGYERLYRLLDKLALEFFDDGRQIFLGADPVTGREQISFAFDSREYAMTSPEILDANGETLREEYKYFPEVDVSITATDALITGTSQTIQILDSLIERIKGVDQTNWLIVKEILSEGSEEVASDIVNTFGDIMISGMTGKENKLEKEFQSKRAELLLTGMTTAEAEKQAAKQVLWEEFEDLKGSFVAGGISGGLFGIGGTAINAAAGEVRDIRTGRAIKKGDFESFRKLAADFGLTLSEDASSRETGKALRDIQTKATNEAIEKRLNELGEKNNPATRAYLVEAIKAEATGQRLNAKEERALKASKNGAQVAAEYGQMANGEA